METHISSQTLLTTFYASDSLSPHQTPPPSSPISTSITPPALLPTDGIGISPIPLIEGLLDSPVSQTLGDPPLGHSPSLSPSYVNKRLPISSGIAGSVKTLGDESPTSEISISIDQSLVLSSPKPEEIESTMSPEDQPSPENIDDGYSPETLSRQSLTPSSCAATGSSRSSLQGDVMEEDTRSPQAEYGSPNFSLLGNDDEYIDDGWFTFPSYNSSVDDNSRSPISNAWKYTSAEPTGVGAGLINLGNTCYMNSVMQCITHTVPLLQRLGTYNHSYSCQRNIEDFCVICALSEHIDLALSFSGGLVKPLKLVHNLNYFSSSFGKFEQEDAHEFLQSFLDKLEKCCLDSNRGFCSQNANMVEQVFGGRLMSRLSCCNCGHWSDTYEASLGLSLEIEDMGSLQGALQSFTSVEKLEDELTCDNCEKKVFKEKQLMIDQSPLVAALHLKRFKNDGMSVEKISNRVDFPLELDLTPYSVNSQSSEVGLKYNLYALVEHRGSSITSGHYFSYVRSSPYTWHKLNDARVFRVGEEVVLSRDAYILFYVRQDVPWFSDLMGQKRLPLPESNLRNTSPKSVLETEGVKGTFDQIGGENFVGQTLIVPPPVTRVEGLKINEETEASALDYELSIENDAQMADCTATASSFDKCCSTATVLPETPAPATSSRCPDPYPTRRRQDSEECCTTAAAFPELPGAATSSECPDPNPTRRQQGSFRIPRDQVKIAKQQVGQKKQAINKEADNLNRGMAIRYLKRMPSSRANMLTAAMGVSDDGCPNKRKKKASPCKKSGSQGVMRRAVPILR